MKFGYVLTRDGCDLLGAKGRTDMAFHKPLEFRAGGRAVAFLEVLGDVAVEQVAYDRGIDVGSALCEGIFSITHCGENAQR